MDNPKVSIRRTKKFGKGVYADQKIRKGETIACFDGPIYDDDYEPWTDDMFNHAIQIGPALWRDSKGCARFLNHSCEPNCGIKGLNRVVAMRAIAAGEQITWDYEMTEKNKYWKMNCQCGSTLCRGRIGHYKNMPAAIRKKYAGYISDWITEKNKK